MRSIGRGAAREAPFGASSRSQFAECQIATFVGPLFAAYALHDVDFQLRSRQRQRPVACDLRATQITVDHKFACDTCGEIDHVTVPFVAAAD
jgi:hypothetical protein